MPEKGGKIKCVGQCASTWHLVVLLAGEKPSFTSPIHPNLVGTAVNPSGGKIVTYAGWPLHTYISDPRHGSYKGQGYGGQWYMISPAGTVITKPVSSQSSSSSSTSSGYGGGGY